MLDLGLSCPELCTDMYLIMSLSSEELCTFRRMEKQEWEPAMTSAPGSPPDRPQKISLDLILIQTPATRFFNKRFRHLALCVDGGKRYLGHHSSVELN
ncbi:hypothetical protein DPEC_G00083740 [Dallia pectoralis]|uniref:Uncharacterized protein n=1 Tax=Dallia pectoralis TaxID=75939 RepID=A0ACC2GZX7_DALPE|nr:hypothetical protein DPEC_G00083740 [Dallia pectoralis]